MLRMFFTFYIDFSLVRCNAVVQWLFKVIALRIREVYKYICMSFTYNSIQLLTFYALTYPVQVIMSMEPSAGFFKSIKRDEI